MVVRKPAWAEDDDEEEDCTPVPTFQSAFTEALGTADWSRYEANAGEQGNAKLWIVVKIMYSHCVAWNVC